MSIVGCVSDPTFEQASDTATTTAPTVSATDHMVLVPATMLSQLETQETKGKGKDKGDEPKPGASPAPAPAPAPGSVGTVVVPAFWIDVSPVSPAAYAACTNAGACTRPSCVTLGDEVACITHAQAGAYCAWANKRMVTNAEWSAAAKAPPSGLTGLSGGFAEWVDSGNAKSGIARGGATSSASTPLGLDSSIPTVGFRCARDR